MGRALSAPRYLDAEWVDPLSVDMEDELGTVNDIGLRMQCKRIENVTREKKRVGRTIKERKYFSVSTFLSVSRRVGAAPDLSRT